MTIGSIGMSSMSANSLAGLMRSFAARPSSSEFASMIIENEDADGDGMISAAETKLKESQFAAMDTDGDGLLTSEEMVAAFAAHVADRSAQTLSRLPRSASDFASMIVKEEDADGDGMISASETRVDTERFNEIDADGDGLLTVDELVASAANRRERPQGPPPGPPPAASGSEFASMIIEQEDTDGDGMISISETRVDEERFAEIDADGDGLLSAEELASAFEANPPQGVQQAEQVDMIEVLLQMLNENEASNAYSSQNWLLSLLQHSGLSLSA